MGKQQEEARAMSPAPTATIKIDGRWNHPERHGAMFDLAASEDMKLREGEVKVIPLGIRMKLPEGYFGLVVPRSSTCLKYGILMANSVGIIESDYCGDSDVWGFVAYATRETKLPKGTRIAQFMPVRMFGDLDFAVVDSMPYPDRGGYGNTSDGYHTFNELYHHRAVLFSVIVKNFATRAWKSKLHADGTMYEGMFIVGIETPDGQATYHYDVEPYWDLFRCKEVDRAPEWDGHTPGQAIERISKLVDLIDRPTCRNVYDENEMGSCINGFECSECGNVVEDYEGYRVSGEFNYCSKCRREVVE